MLRKIILIFLIVMTGFANAQQSEKDSLLAIVNKHNGDTAEVNAFRNLGIQQTAFDTAINYEQKALKLAQKLNYKKGEAECLFVIMNLYYKNNGLGESIEYGIKLLNVYKETGDYNGVCTMSLFLQGMYRDDVGDFRKALNYSIPGKEIAISKNVKNTALFPGHRAAPLFSAEIANTYLSMNKIDSALFYTNDAISQNELFNGAKWNFPFYLLARIHSAEGNYKQSLEYYRKAIPLAKQNELQHQHDTLQLYSGMSTLFVKTGEIDSAIFYGQMVVQSNNPDQEPKHRLEAFSSLKDAYKLNGSKDSAIKYLELSHALKDSLFSIHKDRQVQNITFNQSLKQQEILSEQVKYKSSIRLYMLLAGFFVLLSIAALLWRNNRREHKAKNKIERAYTELKSAQTQLIQSEKMASLGELTAGIAHEIQNPLNFVNNFSEVSREMIDELKPFDKLRMTTEQEDVLNDIDANLEKINHHGKRAADIVKGMLQHSRSSGGQKEPTDINALCDEYLRLSYHGLRAKDKSFNATMKTDFDETIGNINIIPQDIGRVVLNLINNAFYAVGEKLTIYNLQSVERLRQAQPDKTDVTLSAAAESKGYEPKVSISTKKINNAVEIKVTDNGNGIPPKVLDKIFQPFFTTKPTGQGTGLGLSLSYDIVKAHGGELRVETQVDEGNTDSVGNGSVFIISLPLV